MEQINNTAAARELAVRERLLAVFTAIIDAAQTSSFRGISSNEAGGLTVETIGVAQGDDSQLTPEQRAEIESDSAIITTLRTLLDALDEPLQLLVKASRDRDVFVIYAAGELRDAVLNMLTAEAEFEQAARVFQLASEEWWAVDSLTGRVRARCVKQLVESGMAATPADKAASDHPDYTSHKDKCVELLLRKDEAEIERDVAKLRVTNARTLVEALTRWPNLDNTTDHRITYLRQALAYISEGRGRFSRDPQQHANNCIEDMKAVASGALAGTWQLPE